MFWHLCWTLSESIAWILDECKKNTIGWLFVYRNIVFCFFQDHSLGVVTSIWGPQKESACMDGSNTEVTCDEEKHVFCSIKGTNLTKKWQTKIQI